MTAKKSRYESYMLRMWQTSNEEELIWRASLENPSSGERFGFASLEDLCSFLQARTEASNPQDLDKRAPAPRQQNAD